jgi:hypothetical protein
MAGEIGLKDLTAVQLEAGETFARLPFANGIASELDPKSAQN